MLQRTPEGEISFSSFFASITEDRVTRGIVAGVVSHAPALAFNLLTKKIGWSTLIWKDYMKVFLHGEAAGGALADVMSIVAVTLFVGALGGLFSLISPVLSSKNYLLKSCYYALSIWFLTHATTVMFKVPDLAILPSKTVIMQGIVAVIWGACLGLLLRYFEGRAEVER